MIKILYFGLTFFACFLIFSSSLSDKAFILALIEHFDIKYVYQIGNFHGEMLKSLMSNGIYTSVLKNTEDSYFSPKSLILVWKISDLMPFLKLLENSIMWTIKWVMITNETETIKEFGKVFIPLNCEFLLAQKTNSSHYRIDEMYRLKWDSPQTVTFWGEWASGVLIVKSKSDFIKRRANLMGNEFQLADLKRNRAKGAAEISFTEVIQLMSISLNFSLKTTLHDIGRHSFKAGLSTGLYKAIEEEADFIGVPFVVNAERLEYLDFVWPTSHSKTYLFMASYEVKDWTSYVKPFEDKLWWGIAGWIIVAISLLTIHYKICNYKATDSFLDIIRPFCGQDCQHVSRSSLFISRFLPNVVALILLRAYSRAILSFITAPLNVPPFQSLDGFIANGQYKLSYLRQVYVYTYFTTNEGPIPKILRERNLLQDESELPFDDKDAFNQLCKNPRIVYVASEYADGPLDCTILPLQNALFSQAAGLAMKKFSPIQQMAERSLHKVQMAGLTPLVQRLRIPAASSSAFEPLDFEESLPIFLLAAILVFVSLLILIMEILIWRSIGGKRGDLNNIL